MNYYEFKYSGERLPRYLGDGGVAIGNFSAGLAAYHTNEHGSDGLGAPVSETQFGAENSWLFMGIRSCNLRGRIRLPDHQLIVLQMSQLIRMA